MKMDKEMMLIVVKALKNEAVKFQKYEMASNIRDVEKKLLDGKKVSNEEIEKLVASVKSLVFKTESRIGDKYSIDDDLFIEITQLFDQASARRTEAYKLLESAKEIEYSGWELIKKKNPDYNLEDVGYSFIKKTKSIVIIKDATQKED